MNVEVNNAYARRMAIWKALLFVALVAFFADKVSAQAPPYIVQRNGVQQFSANCLEHANQSPVYNFLDSCGGPPPIPPNALTRADLIYIGHRNTLSRNVDMTQWDCLWGRVAANEACQAWPQAAAATPQWVLPRSAYTCTKFRATNNANAHSVSASSYNTASNFDFAITTQCGVFTSTSVMVPVAPGSNAVVQYGGPACSKTGVRAFDSRFITYRVGASTGFICGLMAGTDYYVNVRWTNGSPVEPGGGPQFQMCNAIGCKFAVQSQTNPR